MRSTQAFAEKGRLAIGILRLGERSGFFRNVAKLMVADRDRLRLVSASLGAATPGIPAPEP
jgi:hypothetical protein